MLLHCLTPGGVNTEPDGASWRIHKVREIKMMKEEDFRFTGFRNDTTSLSLNSCSESYFSANIHLGEKRQSKDLEVNSTYKNCEL